jgi:DNA-binding Xre family transcriptional regulator
VPNPSSHGDVIPCLKDLIDEASRFWGIPVTLQMVARVTKLNIKIIRAYYYKERTASYTLSTVGKLRWFFACTPAGVLAWIPPAELASPQLPPAQVGPIQLPRRATQEELTIRNMIPARLAGIPLAEITRGTGLSRKTVLALQNQAQPPQRIRRRTLAAICDFLSRREGHQVAISELLVNEATAGKEGKQGFVASVSDTARNQEVG